ASYRAHCAARATPRRGCFTLTIPTQPLRDEHRELRPHVERLREAAEAVGDTPTPELHSLLEEVNDFLGRHLIPHAQAEEAALYPVVARLMGAPVATATMRHDYIAIGRAVVELRTLHDHLAAAAYQPGEAESQEMFERMEHAATEARRGALTTLRQVKKGES